MSQRAKVGDWIRFYNNGRLVLGVVEYVTENTHYPYDTIYNTDLVPVHASQVLEVRSAPVMMTVCGTESVSIDERQRLENYLSPIAKGELAQRIVDDLVADLNGRQGFDFDTLEDDIREELIAEWVAIVERHIP